MIWPGEDELGMQPENSPPSRQGTPHQDWQLPNRLIHEASPYLLQHARNPVDWYPWGEDAFVRAAQEHKPIFLSIGYSTCHWCHVMAHESFEDRKIAAQLNETCVCIKVDREERPDIDAVYMSICQQMTGQGGWPLTIIMTPDKKPFFAGTYFPPVRRMGMAGLSDILTQVQTLWRDKNEDLKQSAEQVARSGETEPLVPGSARPAETTLLTQGYEELSVRFDPVYGGFGTAPKFPTPHALIFLIRYWHRTGDPHALLMAEKTLLEIRKGGIFDHIGYGIHRYSTDSRWRVPHFEKMLYDQALMVMACTEAYAATKNPEYRTIAGEIIDYVTRDLLSPEAAFFSAEDADSPEGEGAFYLWTYDEFKEILGDDDAAYAAKIFHIPTNDTSGTGETGPDRNILYLTGPGAMPHKDSVTLPSFRDEKSGSVRARLFAARNLRTRPARDDKILTDWNALFCAALARAGTVFEEKAYTGAACRAMEFILTRMRSGDGGLLHRYRKGQAGIGGFADDYAFTIYALLCLYDATFDARYFAVALELDKYFTAHFWDPDNGGYFTISDRAEQLITRKKETYDGAVPSCNSVALENLLRLSRMTGQDGFETRTSLQVQFCTGNIASQPSASAWFLSALDLATGPKPDVVIAGEPGHADTEAMLSVLRSEYRPSLITLLRSGGTAGEQLATLAPFTRPMAMLEGTATAYVCRDYSCLAPVTDPFVMRELLR
ncbi:MAG: thioredoxin domain-containing protein [Methanoregula sp.]|jgi:hypothetical protein